MIMFQLRGLYLWRKMLTEIFDLRDEHCFNIKLNTAIIRASYLKNKLIMGVSLTKRK